MRALLLTFVAFTLSAQTPTIDQSLNLKTAGSPRISPDGRYVAYTVSETNWDDNAFETQIWMAMPATGERYQLTHAKKSSSAPAVGAGFQAPGVSLRSRRQPADLRDLSSRRRSHGAHAFRRRRELVRMVARRPHDRLHLHRPRAQSQKRPQRQVRRFRNRRARLHHGPLVDRESRRRKTQARGR